MLFNSAPFLFLFLPVVLAGYALVLRFLGQKPAQFWLFSASLFFYGWWGPSYLWLILASLIFNYIVGKKLLEQQSRPLLVFGISVDLLLLGYFKYAAFTVANLNWLWEGSLTVPDILLPIGISFITFQKIAFLVDCYRRQVPASLNWLGFGLFVTFFPQLIAGPIVHHREMMPQFARKKALTSSNIAIGLSILALGLFKKVIIADTLASYADPLFTAAETHPLHPVEAWAAALAYTFQIYFDFSGYSDMALGLGKMFGIRLPVNFFSPYRSRNIIEFWRRWHMTLSRFLRDYLYIALGGNRKGPLRRHVNLMLTMILGGLWHGAAWTFVIWGALHGFYLVINHLWQRLKMPRLPAVVATALTFLAVTVAWVFFRAKTVASALSMLGSMAGVTAYKTASFNVLSDRNPLRNTFDASDANTLAPLLLCCLLGCLFLPNTIEIMRKGRPCIGGPRGLALRQNWLARRLVWTPRLVTGFVFGIIAVTAMMKVVYEPSQVFLYFQF